MQCGALRTFSYTHVCYSVLQCVALRTYSYIMTTEKQGLWEERGGGGKREEPRGGGGGEGQEGQQGKQMKGGQFVSFCGQLECPRQT